MNFNRLVSEWAWRVNDGMPDPQNRTHVELLRQVLIESGYEEDWVLEYTQNLFENQMLIDIRLTNLHIYFLSY